jgi:hypothetical protein
VRKCALSHPRQKTNGTSDFAREMLRFFPTERMDTCDACVLPSDTLEFDPECCGGCVYPLLDVATEEDLTRDPGWLAEQFDDFGCGHPYAHSANP